MPAKPRPPAPPSLPLHRQKQLLAFLRQLELDPTAPGGPGDDAATLAPIDEALTHTSAGLAYHHERLEFLGDAVLRLAAAEYLQREHPDLSVGQCSALRAQLVSDRWLAELGERCGLEDVVRIGAMAEGDLAGRRTVLAETCEALIGGLYESWGGSLEPVHLWLDSHWRHTTAALLADPDQHNWKSALQEWSQGQSLGLPVYQCQERSRRHADPRRFVCRVSLAGSTATNGAEESLGEGWGGSRREAEQQAARAALQHIRRQQC
ncbi:ribonuclease III [Synechococcus sp. CCY9202]|uniref:ribonuclease III n=1 Tax=Synechococcus sp. CCY9202 TaxID=174698 RepID=UPI002B200C28|nr:ribonuclease III [Synechococcus sp. CCY9202]MEA5422062.1 ribonuclease III [Synechococcus sp. CCY9202]